jgi:hypothetical protein
MTRRSHLVAFAAVLLLFTGLIAAPPLSADPVQITSGYLIAEGLTFPSLPDIAIDMAGTQGFTLRGTPREEDGSLTAFGQCGGCAPGVAIDLRTVFSGLAFQGTSVATLNGVEYTDIGSIESGKDVSAVIEFTGTAIAPPWANGAHATISAPFAFNGVFLTGQLPDPSTLLTGSGIATLSLRPFLPPDSGAQVWQTERLEFAFADLTAVPEPATLTLLGSGLAAAVASARRRKRGAR